VNRLTHRTIDPRSKIPEFKVSAARLARAAGPPPWAREENGGSSARHLPVVANGAAPGPAGRS
jgi:hypothetical protein